MFAVVNTSYDTTSAGYNVALTTNSIFRVELESTPKANLAGLTFVNITQNPRGSINNVSSGSATFDYDTTQFPGAFNLGNNRVYSLELGGDFEKLFLTEDTTIRDLPIGTTTVHTRNRNILGRFSRSVTKSVTVDNLPIQKVQAAAISESLYREQTGGVAVQGFTLSF